MWHVTEQPVTQVREFETDMKNAFDWNKITFADIPLHQWAWWVAFIFAMLTCVVSGQVFFCFVFFVVCFVFFVFFGASEGNRGGERGEGSLAATRNLEP
jgi:hypothetical protein